MKTFFKTLFVSTAVVTCCWGAAVVPGSKLAKAYETQCYYDRAYFAKVDCSAIARDELGKVIQICCR